MPAIEDYIALLALAQINSLDKCQALPSVMNLLASGCAPAETAITANDLGYLKAVYAANPGGLPAIQKNEIARRMEQGIPVRRLEIPLRHKAAIMFAEVVLSLLVIGLELVAHNL